MINQRFKFGAILAFTLIQLSNGLDGGLVVPHSRKKIKKLTVQIFPLLIVRYPTSLGYHSVRYPIEVGYPTVKSGKN